MNYSAYLRSFIALVAAVFAFRPVALGQSATAQVSGRVSHAVTKVALSEAVVAVRGTAQQALTAEDGTFRLQLAPGSYVLEVSYTGLEPQTLPITVQTGQNRLGEISLTAEVYKMAEYTVSGEREGTALAVHQQRHAPNIKNVVSADAFGNVADENIGNFLQRIPGVGVQILEGEISYVQIRGVDADLSAVTLDGTRAPSGGTGSGLGRAFEIDKIPADFIESIEVTKAATPDMDADSIGGTVNLKTKSAFSRRGRVITGQLGTSYNVDRESFRPALSFMYSNTVGPRQNVGVMFTMSHNQTHKPRDSSNILWEQSADLTKVNYFWLQNFGEDYLQHNRSGAGLRLDYKLSDRASVYVNTLFSYYDDELERRSGAFAANRNVVATYDAAGIPRTSTGTLGFILPGWTDTVTETINHPTNINQTYRERAVTTWNFQVGGKVAIGRGDLDFNANYAPSHGDEDRLIPNGTVAGTGFRFTRRGATLLEWTQLTGPDIYDPANRILNSINTQDDEKNDTIWGAQANLRQKFDVLSFPTEFKIGTRVRGQKRDRILRRTSFSYVGPDGVAGRSARGVNDDDLARFVDRGYNYRPYDGFYPTLTFLSVDRIRAEMQANPSYFLENRVASLQQLLRNNVNAAEDVYAVYASAQTQVGKLGITTGVRAEETRITGTGSVQEITPEERARRLAWVGVVTEQEQIRRTLAEYGKRRTARGQYRDFFPSVHLKYEPIPRLIARASYSTGIGRPNFDTIIPNDTANHETMAVVANNAKLQPQYSQNYDLSLEYYFKGIGLISAGVFRKDIDDFIFLGDAGLIPDGPDNGFGGEYAGYRLRTQQNGGEALIRGYELSYQQQFTNLPGFWKGFGAFANYTRLKTEGNYGTPGANVTQAELVGFVPRSSNYGLTYAGYRWTFRAQMNYTSSHLFQFNANPLLRQYHFSRNPVDLSVKYKLTEHLSLFADLINAFRAPLQYRYMAVPFRPIGNDRFSPVLKLGVSGRF
jgi:iron complex outermembrane recepter protein